LTVNNCFCDVFDGRIHFAGAETATVWCGFMNGAAQAGRRAAVEVTVAALAVTVLYVSYSYLFGLLIFLHFICIRGFAFMCYINLLYFVSTNVLFSFFGTNLGILQWDFHRSDALLRQNELSHNSKLTLV